MRGLGAPKRACQIARRGKSRGCRVDAAGQARGDLLKNPAVAVRIFERGERAVTAMLGTRPRDADSPKEIRLARPGVHVVAAVEHLADRNAASEQVGASRLDVG